MALDSAGDAPFLSRLMANLSGYEADTRGADVIVRSTRGLTGPARALLGSVADEVVRTATRPVLLVRQRQRAR